MNILLFITVLVVSFTIVRIGAIAFQLTGLDWSQAKFQALSCFTSTGFTTKEAELVTADKQRRRIASVLIVLGHAGLVTMIATLANSLRAQEVLESRLLTPILPFRFPPIVVQLVNLFVIIIAVYAIYRIFTNTLLARKLTNSLRKRIIKRELFKPVTFEELLLATGGYGVSRTEVCAGSPVLDKSLATSNLRNWDITVLAIVRDGQTTANPSANTKILKGDELICFGRLDTIRGKICMNP
ncbi:MAG: hypothetical protein AMJ65_00210 [Phycisphaerae bacterium SG8_4]|nr:MAG: hypothetical protein AMJ65_00210 [Phycisphaerae bacterium SG8_4]